MNTILYDRHCKAGARMANFAGWMMPIQYESIIQEHLTVRNHVGIFDVSHMGRILIEGPDAENFLDYLSVNSIKNKKDFSAVYSPLCNIEGGCIDDVIIYRENKNKFFLVANASNREKDLTHIKKEASNFNVTIKDLFDDNGILTVQGPSSFLLLDELFPGVSTLRPFQFNHFLFQKTPITISYTGYTGEQGVEIFAPNAIIVKLWDELLEKGAKYQIAPCGLGARDTLRLEMGYPLYSQELDDTISPIESVASWTVKLNKKNFIGKEALLSLVHSNKQKFSYGLILDEKAIPRTGFNVLKNGKVIGKVTSGTFSPSLQKAIALIIVNTVLNENDQIEVEIRNKIFFGKISKLPFLCKSK